jgi:hypothetical protein
LILGNALGGAMISAINSHHSAPVSVQVPQQINEHQDSAVGSSSAKKGRIRTGVAECNDSFEHANTNKNNGYDFSGFYSYTRNKEYIPDPNKIAEKQKIEQSKAYRPDQQGVTLDPSLMPAANVNASLAANLSANMIAMIRV